jgi:acetyl-CoA synthetase
VKGEAIWCYCVLGEGKIESDATRASISDHVAQRLGGPFRPGAVKFVTELPRTRNAKVLRRAVRAAALGADQGDLSNLENPSSLDEVASAR